MSFEKRVGANQLRRHKQTELAAKLERELMQSQGGVSLHRRFIQQPWLQYLKRPGGPDPIVAKRLFLLLFSLRQRYEQHLQQHPVDAVPAMTAGQYIATDLRVAGENPDRIIMSGQLLLQWGRWSEVSKHEASAVSAALVYMLYAEDLFGQGLYKALDKVWPDAAPGSMQFLKSCSQLTKKQSDEQFVSVKTAINGVPGHQHDNVIAAFKSLAEYQLPLFATLMQGVDRDAPTVKPWPEEGVMFVRGLASALVMVVVAALVGILPEQNLADSGVRFDSFGGR